MKPLTNLNDLVATNVTMNSLTGFQQPAPQIITQLVPLSYCYQQRMQIVQPDCGQPPPSYQVATAPQPPAYQ